MYQTPVLFSSRGITLVISSQFYLKTGEGQGLELTSESLGVYSYILLLNDYFISL